MAKKIREWGKEGGEGRASSVSDDGVVPTAWRCGTSTGSDVRINCLDCWGLQEDSQLVRLHIASR